MNMARAKKPIQKFFKYLEARLRLLPADIQVKVQELLEHRFFINLLGKSDHLGGFQPGGRPKIVISIPPQIYRSILDFEIRVHELEHAIQVFSIGGGPSHISLIYYNDCWPHL